MIFSDIFALFVAQNFKTKILTAQRNILLECLLVHENGDKLFTDEGFSMIETWQLSEIRKGPETVRKKKY